MRHRAWPPLRPRAKLPRRHPLERQRVEPAKFQKRRVAAQLPQKRLDRGVLEHDPREQRTPHRRHRVIVAPAAAAGLKRRDDIFVGKGVEHQP